MNNKVISLKREIKDDYNYRESLKTLRTNIQFCGSNITFSFIWKCRYP